MKFTPLILLFYSGLSLAISEKVVNFVLPKHIQFQKMAPDLDSGNIEFSSQFSLKKETNGDIAFKALKNETDNWRAVNFSHYPGGRVKGISSVNYTEGNTGLYSYHLALGEKDGADFSLMRCATTNQADHACRLKELPSKAACVAHHGGAKIYAAKKKNIVFERCHSVTPKLCVWAERAYHTIIQRLSEIEAKNKVKECVGFLNKLNLPLAPFFSKIKASQEKAMAGLKSDTTKIGPNAGIEVSWYGENSPTKTLQEIYGAKSLDIELYTRGLDFIIRSKEICASSGFRKSGKQIMRINQFIKTPTGKTSTSR